MKWRKGGKGKRNHNIRCWENILWSHLQWFVYKLTIQRSLQLGDNQLFWLNEYRVGVCLVGIADPNDGGLWWLWLVNCPWLGGIRNFHWKLSWLTVRVVIYWLLRTASRAAGKETISMRSPQSSGHDFLCKGGTQLRGGVAVGPPLSHVSALLCRICMFLHRVAWSSNCAISHETQKLAPVGVRRLRVVVLPKLSIIISCQ